MAKKKAASKSVPSLTEPKLPEGIEPGDLVYPKMKWDDKTGKTSYNKGDSQLMYEEADGGQFELWYIEGRDFGWVIPTLMINSGHHRNRPSSDTRRTYGIRLSDEGLVRVGHGPHVKKTVTVYVKEHRTEALKKFLDLYAKGLEKAGMTRDRISTRRANTQSRRSSGGFGGILGW